MSILSITQVKNTAALIIFGLIFLCMGLYGMLKLKNDFKVRYNSSVILAIMVSIFPIISILLGMFLLWGAIF